MRGSRAPARAPGFPRPPARRGEHGARVAVSHRRRRARTPRTQACTRPRTQPQTPHRTLAPSAPTVPGTCAICDAQGRERPRRQPPLWRWWFTRRSCRARPTSSTSRWCSRRCRRRNRDRYASKRPPPTSDAAELIMAGTAAEASATRAATKDPSDRKACEKGWKLEQTYKQSKLCACVVPASAMASTCSSYTHAHSGSGGEGVRVCPASCIASCCSARVGTCLGIL